MEQMTDVMNSTLQALFLSALAAAFFAPIMIAVMYKTKQVVEHKASKLGGGVSKEDTNKTFLKIMNVSGQNGTPNIGGTLIWIIVPLMTLLLVSRTPDIDALLFGFIIFGLWGFIDVVFTNRMKKDEAFRIKQERFGVRMVRFWISALISIFTFYLLYRTGIVKELSFGEIAIPFTLLLVVVTGIVGHFAVYAAEISDGLDGLMIGMFGIIFTGIGALLLIQQQYEYLPIIGIIIGAIFVDLYFNIPPARFFNGGPGAMTLGFAAFYVGVVTDNLIPYFIMSAWIWFIMSTSLIQILSMRFRKKRVFKIAPIHHHFQAIGWPSYKVTMRFWLVTMILSVFGLYIGLIIK